MVRIPRVLSGLGLALAVGLSVLLAPPARPASAAPDAAALYREALATTRAWRVHYYSESSGSGGPFLYSGDAGPASGTQAIFVGHGATLISASLIVIGDFTYLNGNELAMEDLVGLSPAQAATATGHWVMFSTNNATYAQVVAGVRSRDVAQEIALSGPYTFGRPRQLFGHEVDAIRGTQSLGGKKSAAAVLYVRASDPHLLVEEDSLGQRGTPDGVEHIVFSKWGERVRPTAPAGGMEIGPVNAA
ncbi:MAG: hypothetical protein ACLQRH_14670 [Acidimicrobiales bacterium]